MSAWQPIETAPKGVPVLVLLSAREARGRDGMHGSMQVAANRGRGWISIPGLWLCHPTHWHHLPAHPKEGETQP